VFLFLLIHFNEFIFFFQSKGREHFIWSQGKKRQVNLRFRLWIRVDVVIVCIIDKNWRSMLFLKMYIIYLQRNVFKMCW